MNFECGSMWRKWDLHVHTPMSILCNNYSINKNERDDFLSCIGDGFNDEEVKMYYFIRELFNKALKRNIVAIGITDYFFLDGYKFIKKALQDKEKMKIIFKRELSKDVDYLDKIGEILIFPNIEFRTDVVISENKVGESNKCKQSKLQVHVIFSNELDVEIIEQNFINALKFSTGDDKLQLNKMNVERFGQDSKKSGIGGAGSNLVVGANSIAIKIEDLHELSSKKEFKGKTIIVLPEEDQSSMKWDSQSGGIRQKYYKICGAIFTSNTKTMNWCLSEECKETIGKYLPYLWGSDAHDYSKIFAVENEKFCWIKADVTFDGLLYALYRFNNRIYIGKAPSELQKFKAREFYTIKSLNISPVKENGGLKWFDSTVCFNPYMTTIIGNKGSGKSAITDILGYLCNSHKMKQASFLNPQRFLNKKTKYGNDYKALVKFYDTKREVIERNYLSCDYDDSKIENIKYLPQSYIEEVCNNIDNKFQEEINNAIFSYVPVQERTGANNIKELIDIKTKSIDEEISNLQSDLRSLNKEIIDLEDKSTEKYKNEISNELQAIRQKYENHLKQKPIEVKKPEDIEESNNAKLVVMLKGKLSNIKSEVEQKTEELTKINIELQEIYDFKTKISAIIDTAKLLNDEYTYLAEKFKFPSKLLIHVKVNDTEIIDLEKQLNFQKNNINKLIKENAIEGENNSDLDFKNVNYEKIENIIGEIENLNEKIELINFVIEKVGEQISIEQQKYFAYQKDFEKWTQYQKMLLGDLENIIDGTSIKKLEETLKYITEVLNKDLEAKREQRRKKIDEIIQRFFDKRKILEDIYKPVQHKIESMEGLKKSNIVFKSFMRVDRNKLTSDIMGYIDLRKNSDFKENHFVENIVESTDFENKESILKFVETIYSASTDKINDISYLIKNRSDFNYFVGSIEYLEPNFTINADGKSLNELSPGGRGIVLLIFYLTLSKANIPLIIDQPEDNLDNQSVYSKLVPAIIEAKKNRQIIIVTHNPNIAIACDSEAIVYCEQEKNNRTLNYYTGSIENKKMNENILNVLEGTLPAFDVRKGAYKKA